MKRYGLKMIVIVVLVVLPFSCLLNADENNQGDGQNMVAQFVRGYIFDVYGNSATVQVELLPIQKALEKSKIWQKISDEMLKLCQKDHKMIKIKGDYAQINEVDRKKIDALENKFYAIKGEICQITLPSSEVRKMRVGTVIQRSFVEKELVERQGQVSVYRYNFWKTEIVRY